MIELKPNFDNPIGKIKPMHAVNNAPMFWTYCDIFHFLTEAGIPYARLHDTGGIMGGGVFVDVANLFPDFDADPDDPQNYEFGFTDHLLRELTAAKVQPFYRLGCTIENYHPSIGPRRSIPPKDPHKWAVICEHIIRHYNEGWADGYRMGITYWEIWNEPDNEPLIEQNPMWRGTMEEYFTLYEVTATHLKACFPTLKIGGYASCGFYEILNTAAAAQANVSSRTGYFIEFFEKFLTHITGKGHEAPLDFFSWHSYSGPEENIRYAAYAREMLDKHGFTETESILNEWNPGTHRRGTLADASAVGAMMVAMQNSSVDLLMYYGAMLESSYGGLFNPITNTPFKAYYAMVAFNRLYELGTQYELCHTSEGGKLAPGVYGLAAGDGQGKQTILVVNGKCIIGQSQDVSLSAPTGKWQLSLLDMEHDLSPVGMVNSGESFVIPADGVALLETI
ncbi:MAG: hypothetical protein IJW00_06085 [Clostridia bacterium]|nr:hypothetical protein [Clostridia bacterium]